MTWVVERFREMRCLLLHWSRQRDSYSNRCTRCYLEWP